MILTPEQINELLEIVDVYSLQFASDNISDKYLTKTEREILKKYGIKVGLKQPTVLDAFKYGKLSMALGKEAENMSFYELKKYIRSNSFLPLDSREKKVLESLEYEAYHEIRGLGNRFKNDISRMLVETDKQQRVKFEQAIKDSAKETVAKRGSIKMMSSLIGHKTKDWARDLDRISDFVLHNAHDMGRASQMKETLGENAKAYKHVFDQACDTCVKLYLTKGRGSKPKVFSVNELIANGTNIGRKKDEMKPVLGATHPWCRCELEAMPRGDKHVWDEEKGTYVVELTPRQEMLRQKIKVTIKGL